MGACCGKCWGKCRKKKGPKKGTQLLTPLNTKVEFEDVVGTDKLIVIDCFAKWCGPCQQIAPAVEKMAVQYKKVQFYTLDVDVNADTAKNLEISSMPTFVIFKGGAEVARTVGADLEKVKANIEKYSKSGSASNSRRVSNATRSSQSTNRIRPRKSTLAGVEQTLSSIAK